MSSAVLKVRFCGYDFEPEMSTFRQWLDLTGPKLPRHSDLAVAVRDALTR